jgi:hypothetical protein
MLNRCVVIAKAREPFLEWLRGLPDPCDVTLDEVNGFTTSYLLPYFEEDHEWDRILSRYFDLIFEDQLSGWWVNKANWPAKRNIRTFRKWFDVEFHTIVLDLVDGPIRSVV